MLALSSPQFIFEYALVSAEPKPAAHHNRVITNGYKPCGIGSVAPPADEATARPGIVPMATILEDPITLLKIDIDSIDGHLLSVALKAIKEGRANISSSEASIRTYWLCMR